MKQLFKKIKWAFLFTFVFNLLVSLNTQAQGGPTVICDTCTSAWSSNVTSTFNFSLPSKPGCLYKAYVTYRTRTCNGNLQYEIVSHVFEDLNPIGSGCDLNCPDAAELDRVLNRHVLNLIGSAGATIIKALPSPCYYTGKIIVPPGAEVCMGMTPGTQRTVLVPCDLNGCCYTELTVVGPNQYYQQVITSTSCPTTPVIPPSATIQWSCDILGGGSATFTAIFIPDMPLVCQMLCNTGFFKGASSTGVDKFGIGDFASFKVFPNPFVNAIELSFEANKAKEEITVELFDITGKKVSSKREISLVGKQVIALDAKDIPSGTYLCKFSFGKELITTKLIKQ